MRLYFYSLVVSGSDDLVGDYGEGVRRAVESMEAVGLKNNPYGEIFLERNERKWVVFLI